MYIYQNGRLYVHEGKQLVGVNVYSDKVVKVTGTTAKLDKEYLLLTPYEVRKKFHIDEQPYMFPKPTTTKVKTTKAKTTAKVKEVKK
jgi:hypothetical protein